MKIGHGRSVTGVIVDVYVYSLGFILNLEDELWLFFNDICFIRTKINPSTCIEISGPHQNERNLYASNRLVCVISWRCRETTG